MRLSIKAIKDGMKGIAVTDRHGNMFAIKEFTTMWTEKQAERRIKTLKKIAAIDGEVDCICDKEAEIADCKASKIVEAEGGSSPFGCECAWHAGLWIKGRKTIKAVPSDCARQKWEGIITWSKLVSLCVTKGYYNAPMQTGTNWRNITEGLIICSACLGGGLKA